MTMNLWKHLLLTKVSYNFRKYGMSEKESEAFLLMLFSHMRTLWNVRQIDSIFQFVRSENCWINFPIALIPFMLINTQLRNLYFLKHFYNSLRFLCHHNEKNKVDRKENKRGMSMNTKCGSYIKIEVKKETDRTLEMDPLLKVSTLIWKLFYSSRSTQIRVEDYIFW